ncbi:MAG: hypothetical protein QNJ00_05570 [Woeseiaceae bacterium]|nr:hypothetical protein [Woeseiaceae bacterium]
MRTSSKLIVFAALALASASAQAAGDPLFADDTTVDVTLTAPFYTLVRKRPREEYLPGSFKYTDSDGNEVELYVGVRTRGHFRHQTCDFPPLRLNFKKSKTKGTLLEGQDKVKLVVHCDNSSRYEQGILREYLAYRVLNLFTDQSFRVRLLRVTYVDSEERRKPQTRYAFFIEHKSRLAKRIGQPPLLIEETDVRALESAHLNLTSVFQFFIANTDFSPIAGPPDSICCHNYVLFGEEGKPITAIPYDFDQSGFVDAPYAAPDARFRIRTVSQRLYRGRCMNNDEMANSIEAFREKRAEIEALINNQEGATEGTRKRLLKFIERYYAMTSTPEIVERRLARDCTGPPS